MKLQVATLCDAATIREGLLHLLGGGVAKSDRSAFPSPLGLTLAIQIRLEDEERGQHILVVRVLNSADDEVGRLDGEMHLTGNNLNDADLPIVAAAAIPIAGIVLPKPDLYRVEIAIDEQVLDVLTLRAAEAAV